MDRLEFRYQHRVTAFTHHSLAFQPLVLDILSWQNWASKESRNLDLVWRSSLRISGPRSIFAIPYLAWLGCWASSWRSLNVQAFEKFPWQHVLDELLLSSYFQRIRRKPAACFQCQLTRNFLDLERGSSSSSRWRYFRGFIESSCVKSWLLSSMTPTWLTTVSSNSQSFFSWHRVGDRQLTGMILLVRRGCWTTER